MNYLKLYFLLIATLFFFIRASAELSSDSQEALKNTQEMLTNTQKREAAQKGDQKVQAMDKQLESSMGSTQNKEAIYQLSSKVLETMTNKANGDATQMQEMIEAAQKNPEAFYNQMFTEEQKAQVRQLSSDVEKSKSPHVPANK